MAYYFRQFVNEPDFEAFSSRCVAAPRCACVDNPKRGLGHRRGSCALPGGEFRFHTSVAVWTLQLSASSLLVTTFLSLFSCTLFFYVEGILRHDESPRGFFERGARDRIFTATRTMMYLEMREARGKIVLVCVQKFGITTPSQTDLRCCCVCRRVSSQVFSFLRRVVNLSIFGAHVWSSFAGHFYTMASFPSLRTRSHQGFGLPQIPTFDVLTDKGVSRSHSILFMGAAGLKHSSHGELVCAISHTCMLETLLNMELCLSIRLHAHA